MTIAPGFRFPPLNVITPFSVESQGTIMNASAMGMISLASTAPGANFVYYNPFMIYERATAVKMTYVVGATSNGNCDLGIYDARTKTRLVNSGSTAQGAINTLQEIDITDTILTPGRYFMALTLSSGTGTIMHTSQVDELFSNVMPAYVETTGGFGLPATAAFAMTTASSPSVPLFGVNFNTLV